MNILCYGSLNLDVVYRVPHIVSPHETLASSSRNIFSGGKGLNQSIAAARALERPGTAPPPPIPIRHAGAIGTDGSGLVETLRRFGVDTSLVRTAPPGVPTGHAVIQVGDDGSNAIVIHPGANHTITHEDIDESLGGCAAGDIVMLQNEINALPYIITRAAERGLRVFVNFAPYSPDAARTLPLEMIDTLIVNEIEAAGLAGAGAGTDPEKIIDTLVEKLPNTAILLTVGEHGARYGRGSERLAAPAYPVTAVDTTGAGDTFVGYYAAEIAAGSPVGRAMRVACCAASLSIGTAGAAQSIPAYGEVAEYLSRVEK